MRKVALWLIVVVMMAGIAFVSAYAQHPPEHQSIHDIFYKSWFRPDNRMMSCCNNLDCAPAQAKMVNGTWVAKRDRDANWITVPSDKVERERDNPDGRSHLCATWMQPGPVFCFIPGTGM